MNFRIIYRTRDEVLKTEIVSAFNDSHALFLARAGKKRIYNNTRRIHGEGVKGIILIINPVNE